MTPFVERWHDLANDLLGPPRFPRHPLITARFGIRRNSIRKGVRKKHISGRQDSRTLRRTRSTFVPFSRSTRDVRFWISARRYLPTRTVGRSQKEVRRVFRMHLPLTSEISEVRSLPNHRVESLVGTASCKSDSLRPHSTSGRSTSPVSALPSRIPSQLSRYRYGPGAFKMDWALSEPVPWRSSECSQAATIHLGGSFAEILASEKLVNSGQHAEKPFIILCQPSLFDPVTRAAR